MEMKCDLCNGTGRLLKPWFDATGAMTRFPGDICFMCDGKGKVDEPQTKKPNTNFEDITSSPEKLAEFIQDAMAYCKHCKADCATACGYYQQHEIVPCAGDGLVDWLKRESDSK